jgi:hypothetical protein
VRRPDGPDHEEEMLDEALEETFPASDPVAMTSHPILVPTHDNKGA